MKALAFARFDAASWLPRKQSILSLVLIAAVAVILPIPGMGLVAAAFVTSVILSTPFLGDERGRLDVLYGVLPLARSSVVVGRALAIVTYYGIATVVAAVTTVGVALIEGDPIPIGVTAIVFAASFAFVGLALSLQLPVLFRIGYARGRLIAYAPAAVVAGIAWLSQTVDFVSIAPNAVDPWTVLAAGLALGILGLGIGTVVAIRMYATRELS